MRAGLSLPSELPSFASHLAWIDGIFAPSDFARITAAIEILTGKERGYVPAHKRGATVAYSTLRKRAPLLVDLYRSPAFLQLMSGLIGERLLPTPLKDESSCSVLFYEKPGDHIGWHYDHNFYRGRHFTVLIPIINRGPRGGLSAARLYAKLEGEESEIATPPNRLIVFEGARVRHKVTPIAEGERRVVWSMTFCTDPRNTVVQDAARRVKDTAFFGLRALWRQA